MLKDNRILVGKNEEVESYLRLDKACRHGLITGASGSGKTITLKLLTEGFSSAGVPVILADVKGDLAGLAKEGEFNSKIEERVEKLNLEGFNMDSYPCVFYDVFGKKGHPLRTTVSKLGYRLLARMLGLNETQEGILAIIFKIIEDEKLELIDLNDLRTALIVIGEKRQQYTMQYGNITSQSIGAIQRALLEFESEGGADFFGKPEFELKDLRHFDSDTGKAYINILHSTELFQSPVLYSSVLLYLLTELYNSYEEVGDVDKPKLVMFIDEAHLLFDDMPGYLLKSITQIVKLIRSKGIGVYFISQSPNDIPEEIAGQLGNRVQHNLRCYTPNDEKVVKAAAGSYRSNPKFDTAEAIKTLGTGEAVVSMLDEKGEPTIAEKVTILPPQSRIGVLESSERIMIINDSFNYNKYETKYIIHNKLSDLGEQLASGTVDIKETTSTNKIDGSSLIKKDSVTRASGTATSTKSTAVKKSTGKKKTPVQQIRYAASTVNQTSRALKNIAKLFK